MNEDWESQARALREAVLARSEAHGAILLEETEAASAPLLEWLGSTTIYSEDQTVTDVLRKEVQVHFSARACCEHYLSIAKSNYDAYVDGRESVIRKK